jgi:hypothetical protein
MIKRMQLFFRRNLFPWRKRKIKVTVEIRQTLLLRGVRKSSRIFCPVCASETLFISSAEAARLIRSEDFSLEDVFGKLHIAHAPDGGVLICFNSLKPALESS